MDLDRIGGFGGGSGSMQQIGSTMLSMWEKWH